MSIRYYFPSLLFEVTARTVAGAFLFDPVAHPGFAAAFNAIIAIAQKKHGVRVYAYFAMSNHYHGIFGADNPDSFADFLCDVHGNMARYANRVQDRVGPVFNGRCDVTPIIAGDKCLAERVCYIMGQAIKVHEQWTLDNWPGANTNRALMYGEPLIGKHFDRHQKTLDARLKGGPKADAAYVSEHGVVLTPLPGWESLPEPELRARYRAIGAEAWQRYGCGRSSTPCGTSAEGGIVQLPETAGQSSVPCPQLAGPVAANAPPEPPAHSAGSQSPSAAGLTAEQKAWMQMPRPRPKRKEGKRQRRPEAYADTEAQVARYREAYKAVREAHVKARLDLQEQAERALRGQRAKAVMFPLYTFAAVARTGWLARELGKTASLGDLA